MVRMVGGEDAAFAEMRSRMTGLAGDLAEVQHQAQVLADSLAALAGKMQEVEERLDALER